ncbi:unnamed protein product [Phyllotreta striolata]|uniref:Protein lethal(3)malignant blood neoplasm 1 n=1 Tax=Phyllotreta striolata TaxID=444603 RepID=A0A9N9TMN3_PHYSR|nr:unnamed protein product [Phyllotreta striolata]
MLSKKVFICVLFTLNVILGQKDSDEGRPYEFGFTIDGQQHRHEKKDQNGIIQGEFGFITADGVYHVTVYATDENGNFKILSMKNIRISAPLDGSPALGPISPEASKYLKKPNQIEPSPSKPSAPAPATPQQFQRIQEAPVSVTTQKPVYRFTTHSTIRPACAGCGLITPPPPGQKFMFLNPAFQKPAEVSMTKKLAETGVPVPPRVASSPVSGPVVQQPMYKGKIPVDVEVLPTNFQGPNGLQPGVELQRYQDNVEKPEQKNRNHLVANEIQSEKINKVSTGVVPQGPESSRKNSNIHEQNIPLEDGMKVISENTPNLPAEFDSQSLNNGDSPGSDYNISPRFDTNNVELIPNQENLKEPMKDKFGRLVAPPFGSTGPNPLLQPQEVSKLPPISVSDNTIHVMGKKPFDIPIKDKYPGMTAGLPEGVETGDVTNILYKFKYTVGFHGHYEKGLKDGTKIGGYFVNGRDGISRVVTYVADANGYRPKFKFINLGLDSSDTPNEKTEKTFGLKEFEFVWYPIE